MDFNLGEIPIITVRLEIKDLCRLARLHSFNCRVRGRDLYLDPGMNSDSFRRFARPGKKFSSHFKNYYHHRIHIKIFVAHDPE